MKLLLKNHSDLEVIGESYSAKKAIDEVRALKPDLVILDVILPDGTGIDAIPYILSENPDTKILILTMESDPAEVKRAFGLGANGYVLKDADEEEVIEAIRQVAKGRHYVCPQLGARMVFFETERQRNAEIDPLSTREREVVKYVAMGYTNQEIAQRLFVSMRTVEAHRSRIMKKLKLTTRAELVNYATLHEII